MKRKAGHFRSIPSATTVFLRRSLPSIFGSIKVLWKKISQRSSAHPSIGYSTNPDFLRRRTGALHTSLSLSAARPISSTGKKKRSWHWESRSCAVFIRRAHVHRSFILSSSRKNGQRSLPESERRRTVRRTRLLSGIYFWRGIGRIRNFPRRSKERRKAAIGAASWCGGTLAVKRRK